MTTIGKSTPGQWGAAPSAQCGEMAPVKVSAWEWLGSLFMFALMASPVLIVLFFMVF